MAFTVELDNDELGMIVEALRIQKERWHDVVMRKLASDPEVSAIDLGQARRTAEAHDNLLGRLPNRGLNI